MGKLTEWLLSITRIITPSGVEHKSTADELLNHSILNMDLVSLITIILIIGPFIYIGYEAIRTAWVGYTTFNKRNVYTYNSKFYGNTDSLGNIIGTYVMALVGLSFISWLLLFIYPIVISYILTIIFWILLVLAPIISIFKYARYKNKLAYDKENSCQV